MLCVVKSKKDTFPHSFNTKEILIIIHQNEAKTLKTSFFPCSYQEFLVFDTTTTFTRLIKSISATLILMYFTEYLSATSGEAYIISTMQGHIVTNVICSALGTAHFDVIEILAHYIPSFSWQEGCLCFNNV